jgi:uncharacterized membrane protein YraQ (UPF0718 family)/copper chaperone CopZ
MFERYLVEIWGILLELSPSLLMGLLIAGAMHVFLPKGLIRRHLNAADFVSVFRAVLIGVPMPLCSCGVVPTAIGLKNEGASRGATTAFLISTPQTGVDSILVSGAFLGWPFALFKVGAAFVTGVLGGIFVNGFVRDQGTEMVTVTQDEAPNTRIDNRMIEIFRYAIFDLLAMIDIWIVAGVLVAAVITLAFPPDFLGQLVWTQGVEGMLVVLAVAIPLYVCTTSSVPIAASLISAGMPLGTALVFLMAGPATNVATIGAIYRTLGIRVLTIYLGTVIVMSFVLGLAFDFVLGDIHQVLPDHQHDVPWLRVSSAVILVGLLSHLIGRKIRRFRQRFNAMEVPEVDLSIKVGGMSCEHCVANVKRALEAFEEVEEATPSLVSGVVRIRGENLNETALAAAVEKAGYKVLK